ncbi:hypothetical protein NDU88_005926 [Pleurodeles waltl]|uniref:Uncharacterized protein n=1 Tax=Pleurodeles waltl TaxID=8319 RepID=A0AAV7RK51_PLEWA|nr:hypothetical protein NDU88_005926 [Pleurodeles waltl]
MAIGGLWLPQPVLAIGPVRNPRTRAEERYNDAHGRTTKEDDPGDNVVAAGEPVEPVDSEEEEADEDENDNRESVIQQYFQ